MKATIQRAADTPEYFFEEGCFIQELSNTPDDPALSVARARVEPGKITRLHRLARQIERYVVLQGQGEVVVGEDPPAMVTEGDVVTIPAGVAQCIRNTGADDLIFLALCTPRFAVGDYQDIDPLPRD